MKCIQTPSTSHTGMQAAHVGTATASSHSVKVPLVKSFKFVKEEKQRFIYVDTKAALLKGKTKHPLFSVPGLTTRMVRHDGLHVLLVRGVCAYL